jgi:predicted cation transporter
MVNETAEPDQLANGTTEPETDEEPERKPSLLSSFDRDDTKLLIVTIGGTLIANVMTVLVVGLALILAKDYGLGPVETFGPERAQLIQLHAEYVRILETLSAGFVCAGMCAVLVIRLMRRMKARRPRTTRFIVASTVAIGLGCTLMLLLWLGLASGVS